ncbi:MAG: Gx transporter family protein [Bacillota bacterium]|nr:Gx transporter family protein [Bacillota bacterium]
MESRTGTPRLVLLALLTALAIALHYVEALIPVPYVMPGAKLGLANVVALYVVVEQGMASALTVSALRTVLGSLLSGTFLSVTFILSFSGAVLSTAVMGAINAFGRGGLSVTGLSIAGAVTHNVGQLFAAAYIVRQAGVFFYLPYLLLFALPTGFFVGCVVSRLPKHMKNRQHA